ncbi:IS66 family insertion sequence element accessory protein TnpB [Bradyrhizobium sp. UFLA01-814]|uniref:IS66 family insertion sequence element accessory protein TnpB n=1 Tax=Bradyrhizobium sp. UFLA01-814 TaxID=3023480 RepID=UPI00398ADDD0
MKVIWHNGQGACLFTKRLARGKFVWPSVAGESVTISPAQLGYLLSGIDWRNPQETHRPTRVGLPLLRFESAARSDSMAS